MPKIFIARHHHPCIVCDKPILKGKPFTYRVSSGGHLYPVHPECGEYQTRTEKGLEDKRGVD